VSGKRKKSTEREAHCNRKHTHANTHTHTHTHTYALAHTSTHTHTHRAAGSEKDAFKRENGPARPDSQRPEAMSVHSAAMAEIMAGQERNAAAGRSPSRARGEQRRASEGGGNFQTPKMSSSVSSAAAQCAMAMDSEAQSALVPRGLTRSAEPTEGDGEKNEREKAQRHPEIRTQRMEPSVLSPKAFFVFSAPPPLSP